MGRHSPSPAPSFSVFCPRAGARGLGACAFKKEGWPDEDEEDDDDEEEAADCRRTSEDGASRDRTTAVDRDRSEADIPYCFWCGRLACSSCKWREEMVSP